MVSPYVFLILLCVFGTYSAHPIVSNSDDSRMPMIDNVADMVDFEETGAKEKVNHRWHHDVSDELKWYNIIHLSVGIFMTTFILALVAIQVIEILKYCYSHQRELDEFGKNRLVMQQGTENWVEERA